MAPERDPPFYQTTVIQERRNEPIVPKAEPVQVAPPGKLNPDPIVRSDPTPAVVVVVTQEPVPSPKPTPTEFKDPYVDMESDESSEEEENPRRKEQRQQEEIKAQLSRRDHRLHPFWDAIPRIGHYERDNNMRGMLSGHFYVSSGTNKVFHRFHHRDLIDLEGRPIPPIIQQTWKAFFDASPNGMPMTALEVRNLVRLQLNTYGNRTGRIVATLFLRELYTIAQGVVPELRDKAMEYIVQPGVYKPDLIPHGCEEKDVFLHRPDPGKVVGLPNPLPAQALNVDEIARYVLFHGRPGANFSSGTVIDHAFRVHRRSAFALGLIRLLSPEAKTSAFRRYTAILFALPRKYREAIETHNSNRPTDPFVQQQGPVFSITRLQLHPTQVANLNLDTITGLFILNGIPPSWVDHCYMYGLNYLSTQYKGSQISFALEEVDNERLERLRAYGTPSAIPEWDGWYHPAPEDLLRVRQLISGQEARRELRYDHRSEEGWTLVGESGLFHYLRNRPENASVSYRTTHPVILPRFAALDGKSSTLDVDTNMSAPETVDANASAAVVVPMEVETTANASVVISPPTTPTPPSA
jgi:hypothetical protein